MIKDKELLVSVIVMAYNHKDYISQCLDSILQQKTNFSFEIILGEDESNDGTREICLEYAQKYPNVIKLFLRSRKDVIFIEGKPTGRFNFIECLKSACGKYIALCDGDDYWIDENKLQIQVDFLEKRKDVVLVFSKAVTMNINDDKLTLEKKIFDLKNSSKILEEYSTVDIIKGFTPPTRTILFRNICGLIEFMCKNIDYKSGDRILAYWLSLYGVFLEIPDITAVYRFTGKGVHSSRYINPENNILTYRKSFEYWDDFFQIIGINNHKSLLEGRVKRVLHLFLQMKNPFYIILLSKSAKGSFSYYSYFITFINQLISYLKKK